MKMKFTFLCLSIFFTTQLSAQPGTLDSSFGVNGKSTTNIGDNLYANMVAIQPDGKIVAAGALASSAFSIIRYKNDGSPDSSFNNTGILIYNLDLGPNSYLNSRLYLQIQGDGKIIVAGSIWVSTGTSLCMIRLLPGGNIDSSFGVNGKVLTEISGSETFYTCLKLQKDGRILIGGFIDGFYLIRFLADGSIDVTFGNNGSISVNDFGVVMDMAICDDEKIIVESTKRIINGEYFDDPIAVERFFPDGSKDSSFGNDGIVFTGFTGFFYGSTTVLNTGDIIVAGNANDYYSGPIGIIKYKRDGDIDSSFGINGKLITSLGETSATTEKLLVQKDGKILSAGNILARFKRNGTIDSAFGSNGKVSNFSFAWDAVLQQDGKIVSLSDPQFTLYRYKGDTPPIATISASGPLSFCQGDSVILSADTAYSPYLWSTGDTTQSITVKKSGTYSVRVTFINRDTATTAPVTITVNPNPSKPTITANGNIINVCPGKTVTLTSSSATSYVWNTGATTQSIIVNTAGNYTVTVINANGCSNKSDTTKVTYRLCAKPAGLARNNITATAAKLSWTAVPCAVGYQYEWKKKGTVLWSAAQTNLVNRTITGLTPNTTYQWRVITACKISPDTITSAGYTIGPEFKTLAAAFTSNGYGSDEIKIIGSLKANLYPNPTKDIASVSIINTKGKVQITLSDLSGKQLWQSTKLSSTNISIPIQNLAAGTYMVQVKDEKETVMVKMVKE